jgi:hypothetical protein
VVLRPDLRIVVERAEAYRDLLAVRPVAAEERRAALAAERLDLAALGGEDVDQLLTGEEAKLRPWRTSLRQPEGS